VSVSRVRSGAELPFGWHSRQHGALTRATSVPCGVTARSVWRALRVKTLEMVACLGLVGMVSVPCRALDCQQTVAAHPDNWTVALIVNAR
jgi:hypothetical protein